MPTDLICLVVFLICVLLFILDKIPMGTTAVLGCVLMVMLGLCDFKTAFSQFASTTVTLLISIMVVGSAVSETGAAAKIGRIILHISGNDERKILVAGYLISAVLSMFLSNATVLSIFIPIIIGMGMKDRRVNALNLIMPITLGSNMGGISTLVGSTQQMTAHGLLEEIGLHWGVFEFSRFGVILILAGLLYTLFIGYPIGKKIWHDRLPIGHEPTQKEEPKDNKFKLICISVIFTAMVVCFITEVFPTAVTAAGAAALCIITGCVEQKKALSKVNWNVVFRLGGCLGLAKALEAAGSIELISATVRNLVGGSISPFFLFVVIVLFTQVISLFMSNSTAVLITLPIIIAIAPDMGLNVASFAMGIAVASSIGMSCPLSGSSLGIAMTAGYRFKDFFKYGLMFDALGFLLIILIIPALFPLLA